MLRLIIAMIPTYFLIVVGSVISRDSSMIYMAFLSVVISSLIVSSLFVLCVINKPNEMQKINFFMIFYCVFYLLLSYITFVMEGVVGILIVFFYLVAFLFGFLMYLTNRKGVAKYRNYPVENNSFDSGNKTNPNSLGISMAHYPDDLNQAIAMEPTFR